MRRAAAVCGCKTRRPRSTSLASRSASTLAAWSAQVCASNWSQRLFEWCPARFCAYRGFFNKLLNLRAWAVGVGVHQHAAGALRVHRVRQLAAEPAAEARRARRCPARPLLRLWRARQGQGRGARLHRARPQGAHGRRVLGFFWCDDVFVHDTCACHVNLGRVLQRH